MSAPLIQTGGGSGSSVSLGNSLVGLCGGASALLPSMKLAATINSTLSSGDNSLYTVPSGKRAAINLALFNSTVGGITYTQKITVSGPTTYTVGASTPATNLAANSAVAFSAFNTWPIAEAGDIIVLNCSGAGLTAFGAVFTFDNTEPLKSPRVLGLASGNNTVYTCPANKVAYATNLTAAGNAPIRMVNVSGTTRTIVWYCVPSGGSVGTSTQLTPSASVSNNTVNNQTATLIGLSAGDTIVVSSDASTAGQVAYVENLIEIPA